VRSGQSKEAYLQSYPFAENPAYAAHVEHIYDQCAPLASAPEFRDWSTAAGGKWGVRYWRELALKFGNPATRAEVLVEDLLRAQEGDTQQRAAAQTRARAQVSEVLRSGDPEAWYRIGMRLGNSDMSRDVTVGYAVALAACDLGYDCSGNNERNDWYACRWQAGCTETMNLDERLKLMLSAAQYARAYAHYQEISLLLRSRDWEGLAHLVALDGSSFK
jgi:hypothetical protein